tara:strand:+ start:206 stop:889 length:684 start_codon:yes stop_codon:yes gene_type:complete
MGRTPAYIKSMGWVLGELARHVGASSIQKLHGILHGILSDGIITTDEAKGLSEWITDHSELKSVYPYDELESLLCQVLADSRVDEDEQQMLAAYFEDFFKYSFKTRLKKSQEQSSPDPKSITIGGVCAMCPEIFFQGKHFGLTGGMRKGPRSKIIQLIEKVGGSYDKAITLTTDYLVVGAAANPCWAFSCYGRKVEKAINMRKEGVNLLIVHENDFWDALADLGTEV